MIFRIRFLRVMLSMLTLVYAVAPTCVADDRSTEVAKRRIPASPSSSSSLYRESMGRIWEPFTALIPGRIDLPRRPRVARSRQLLFQIELFGGDRFFGEFLNWNSDLATFRSLSGQTIRVPTNSVRAVTNPPGEVDVLSESLEARSPVETNLETRHSLDETVGSSGHRSLKIPFGSSGFSQKWPDGLSTARVEFSFQISTADLTDVCDLWELAFGDTTRHRVTVQVDSKRRISVADRDSQSMFLDDRWHSFIALITGDRIRLLVDDFLLVSIPKQKSALLKALEFHHGSRDSQNNFRIDDLHVRNLIDPEKWRDLSYAPADSDVIRLANGDEIFGHITGLDQVSVTFEVDGKSRMLPRSGVMGLYWHQPIEPIQRTKNPRTGVIARIEMQSFTDRPDCEAEQWTVIVLDSNATRLTAFHATCGELNILWSDIRSIEPSYFGTSIELDARQLHLGNSIRPDLYRHLPDGTDLRLGFLLSEIPAGKSQLSLEVAELEAASPNAPPVSPFLKELRAGQLVTEAFLNDQLLGTLNQQIRFKAIGQNPDRIRLAVPRDLLRIGKNSLRLRQQPKGKRSREFDDGEVGRIRLEFHPSWFEPRLTFLEHVR